MKVNCSYVYRKEMYCQSFFFASFISLSSPSTTIGLFTASSKGKNEILLRKKESEVIIATATNDFITRPIADLFGVEYLIATEFEIEDNKFTGNVVGEPCFREGKLNKVMNWMQENNFENSNTTFYSDSFNDLPLLEAVNKPIVVDGDDKLIKEAKKNDWQYISFR